MVHRHEDGIYLDELDQHELEDVDHAVPGSPMRPEDAVVFAHELRDHANGINDNATDQLDSSSAESREQYRHAQEKAISLARMYAKILQQCPVELVQYDYDRAQANKRTKQ